MKERKGWCLHLTSSHPHLLSPRAQTTSFIHHFLLDSDMLVAEVPTILVLLCCDNVVRAWPRHPLTFRVHQLIRETGRVLRFLSPSNRFLPPSWAGHWASFQKNTKCGSIAHGTKPSSKGKYINMVYEMKHYDEKVQAGRKRTGLI